MAVSVESGPSATEIRAIPEGEKLNFDILTVLDPDDPLVAAELAREFDPADASSDTAFTYLRLGGELYTAVTDPETGAKRLVASSDVLPGPMLDAHNMAMQAFNLGMVNVEAGPVLYSETDTESIYSIQTYELVDENHVTISSRTETVRKSIRPDNPNSSAPESTGRELNSESLLDAPQVTLDPMEMIIPDPPVPHAPLVKTTPQRSWYDQLFEPVKPVSKPISPEPAAPPHTPEAPKIVVEDKLGIVTSPEPPAQPFEHETDREPAEISVAPPFELSDVTVPNFDETASADSVSETAGEPENEPAEEFIEDADDEDDARTASQSQSNPDGPSGPGAQDKYVSTQTPIVRIVETAPARPAEPAAPALTSEQQPQTSLASSTESPSATAEHVRTSVAQASEHATLSVAESAHPVTNKDANEQASSIPETPTASRSMEAAPVVERIETTSAQPEQSATKVVTEMAADNDISPASVQIESPVEQDLTRTEPHTPERVHREGAAASNIEAPRRRAEVKPSRRANDRHEPTHDQTVPITERADAAVSSQRQERSAPIVKNVRAPLPAIVELRAIAQEAAAEAHHTPRSDRLNLQRHQELVRVTTEPATAQDRHEPIQSIQSEAATEPIPILRVIEPSRITTPETATHAIMIEETTTTEPVVYMKTDQLIDRKRNTDRLSNEATASIDDSDWPSVTDVITPPSSSRASRPAASFASNTPSLSYFNPYTPLATQTLEDDITITFEQSAPPIKRQANAGLTRTRSV